MLTRKGSTHTPHDLAQDPGRLEMTQEAWVRRAEGQVIWEGQCAFSPASAQVSLFFFYSLRAPGLSTFLPSSSTLNALP